MRNFPTNCDMTRRQIPCDRNLIHRRGNLRFYQCNLRLIHCRVVRADPSTWCAATSSHPSHFRQLITARRFQYYSDHRAIFNSTKQLHVNLCMFLLLSSKGKRQSSFSRRDHEDIYIYIYSYIYIYIYIYIYLNGVAWKNSFVFCLCMTATKA